MIERDHARRAIGYSRFSMSEWTPEEIKDALRSGDRARLRALALELSRAAEAGHANYLHRRPGFRHGSGRTREDDVQDTLMTLFKDGARVLLKYGERPDFQPSPGALRRFVIGVTWNVLQKRYQDRSRQWEQLEHDLRAVDELARVHQWMDLQKAHALLSPRDQELFDLLYVAQLEPEEICRRRGAQRNALDAQKSRLLKRLLRLLRGDEGAKEGDDA